MKTQKKTVQMLDSLEMVGFIKTNGTQCRFVSMVSKTPVIKIKSNNPFHQVIKKGKVVGDCQLFKVSKKIGIINANYNKSVRNRIAEKLDVELKDVEYENGNVWYEHIKNAEEKALPLVTHKEKGGYYLQYFPHKSENYYVNANDEVIPETALKPWLYKESKRPDYKPNVIAVSLKNICKLAVSGVVVEMPSWEDAEKLFA